MNANGNIKDMTFLAEYSGDIDYLENRANDECDCLMTLLLLILPKVWSFALTSGGTVSAFSVASGISSHCLDYFQNRVQ